MTTSNQSSQTDPRRPSIPTSSLPIVGALPYGHHSHINSQKQTQPSRHQYSSSYLSSASPPPPHQATSHHNRTTSTSATTTNNNAAGGLVTARTNITNGSNNPQITPISSSVVGARSKSKYNELSKHVVSKPPVTAAAAAIVVGTTTTKGNSEASLASSASGGSFRPLNVIDALAYLDQVKNRFVDNPKVYNRFLDIMKDFKSQTIDTPGVIERVSTLFKGHPQLISGFNTFLPTGYRIECVADPKDPNRIIVTTPNGKQATSTTSTAEDTLKIEPQSQQHLLHQVQCYPSSSTTSPSYLPQQQQQKQQYHNHHKHHQTITAQPVHGSGNNNNSSSVLSQSTPPFNTANSHLGNASTAPSTYPHYQHTATTAGSQHYASPPQKRNNLLSSIQTPSDPNEKRPPVEFNHAINYVNRIKNRFVHNPDIYKQFLEVLQTYQKEQRPIGEVFERVRYLFNSADDLLEEFKQFLPEIGSSSSPLSSTSSQSLSSSLQYQQSSPSSYEANPVRFKRVSSSSMIHSSKRKKSHMNKKAKMLQQGDEEEEEILYSVFDPQRPSVCAEEVELFDRIKRHIGNKPSYEAFLKLLNLYVQEIVDIDTLVIQVEGFLGNNKELMAQFKYTIGYKPKEPAIERPTTSAAKPDLNKCEAVKDSPSYRKVSKEWQRQPCSGRDQMCWEVLNDEFVSHPIWASEDSGFVASKKNQYEEALHRCEEERYEYDLNIEANLNTIALLKPIAERIERMSAEEQKAMRLRPGLGGPTVSIYERIIRKIYDNERGSEIIEMLYQRPANVVPIVLRRLELKNKEWRRAQREWNKIWRDIDLKNFYRSLDYQGMIFKMNDRKAMTNKGLIAEIEMLRKEASFCSKPVQFQYEFKDDTIAKDIARLICSFMDKQNSFLKSDKQKVRKFLQTFNLVFFHVKDTLPAEKMRVEDEQDKSQEQEKDDSNHISNTEESDSTPSNSDSPCKRTLSEDSRGKISGGVYKQSSNITATITIAIIPTDSNNAMQDEVDISEDSVMEEANSAVNLSTADAGAAAPDTIKEACFYDFFCNSQYYCLFRLYLTIYERLYKMKTISNQNAAGKKLNQTAVELDLVSTRFEDIDLSCGYYHALMDMFERYFEGEIDQHTFEENTRYIFGTDAYITFTIDKAIHSLIKQIQNVSVDKKSNKLFKLFCQDQQAINTTSTETALAYLSMAEDILEPDESLYKISFVSVL